MSYSRWGCDGSDVYVFAHVNGQIQCCGCPLLDDRTSFDAWSTEAMVDHLAEHVKAKHSVPAGLVECLREDDEENFPKTVVYQKAHRKTHDKA